MRVVEVDPGKEFRRADAVEPRERVIRHLVARTLDAAERDAAVLRQIEVVEVRVEALRHPPLAIEDVRADESAGAEPVALESLGQRGLVLAEEEAAVVAHPVCTGELAGEKRRVCRQRQGRGRDGVLEQRAFASDAIQVRRLRGGETVCPEPIGARGVEGHEQEIQVRRMLAGEQMAQLHPRGCGDHAWPLRQPHPQRHHQCNRQRGQRHRHTPPRHPPTGRRPRCYRLPATHTLCAAAVADSSEHHVTAVSPIGSLLRAPGSWRHRR